MMASITANHRTIMVYPTLIWLNARNFRFNENTHLKKYPKYDNYDAINVNKVLDIPVDYDGIMGVPITFMDKHNPEV